MSTQNLSDAKLRRTYKKWAAKQTYTEHLDELTKTQVRGYFICTGFRMAAPSVFDWSQLTAQEILKTLRRTSFLNHYIESSVDEFSQEEVLNGTEYFRKINAEAQTWAHRLLPKYVSECGCDRPLKGVIDEWLNDTTLETPELMRLHMDAPILHGQIYLELDRLVFALPAKEGEVRHSN